MNIYCSKVHLVGCGHDESPLCVAPMHPCGSAFSWLTRPRNAHNACTQVLCTSSERRITTAHRRSLPSTREPRFSTSSKRGQGWAAAPAAHANATACVSVVLLTTTQFYCDLHCASVALLHHTTPPKAATTAASTAATNILSAPAHLFQIHDQTPIAITDTATARSYLHRAGGGAGDVFRETTLRAAVDSAVVGGVKGFILVVPQARCLAWPSTAHVASSNVRPVPSSTNQPRTAHTVHNDTRFIRPTRGPSDNVVGDDRVTNALCATAWDYLHRNFSSGRRCTDCPMGTLSTNNDVAFIDTIINAEVASGAVDPTRVYVGGWREGGFFAQMYGTARARDEGSTQPSGTCVAAVTVVAAGNPFTNITSDDENSFGAACELSPYPSHGVPTHVTSTVCDASVCCNASQPNCLARSPGHDVAEWVAAARVKLSTHVTWNLLNSSEGTGRESALCDTDPAVCTAAVAQHNTELFPSRHEADMLDFLASHVSDTGCWDSTREIQKS